MSLVIYLKQKQSFEEIANAESETQAQLPSNMYGSAETESSKIMAYRSFQD